MRRHLEIHGLPPRTTPKLGGHRPGFSPSDIVRLRAERLERERVELERERELQKIAALRASTGGVIGSRAFDR